MERRRIELARDSTARITSDSQHSDSDIDWAKQNKMLRDLRWKQRGEPEKTVWWSIQQDIASSHKAGGKTNEGE